MNWDDLKLLLAIGRAGSVSGASRVLKVHRATVLRRFDTMEAQMDARLCARTPEGYRLTPAGRTLFDMAERMEREVLSAEAQIGGQDTRVEGVVHVTMPEPVARHIIAPKLPAFQKRWPGVVMNIIASIDFLDLSRRDADIALRITTDPPESLVGRRFGPMAQAIYSSPTLVPSPGPHKIIGWGRAGTKWPPLFGWDNFVEVSGSSDISIQQIMAHTGAGYACLPCFVGDNDPELIRVKDAVFRTPHEVWALTHPDLRKQARIDAVMTFLTETLSAARPMFAGEAS